MGNGMGDGVGDEEGNGVGDGLGDGEEDGLGDGEGNGIGDGEGEGKEQLIQGFPQLYELSLQHDGSGQQKVEPLN